MLFEFGNSVLPFKKKYALLRMHAQKFLKNVKFASTFPNKFKFQSMFIYLKYFVLLFEWTNILHCIQHLEKKKKITDEIKYSKKKKNKCYTS